MTNNVAQHFDVAVIGGGAAVVHCLYCHGWEVRDQAIGVLGSGPMAVHQALLFRQWTDDLVLFLHTAPPLAPDQAEQLAARAFASSPARWSAWRWPAGG